MASYNFTPNPLTVASFAERLARQDGRMGLAFSIVTAVSLCIVTLNALQSMHDRSERRLR